MSEWVVVNLQDKEDDHLDGAAATERNSEEIPHRHEAQQESLNKQESNLTKEMLDLRKLLTTVKSECNPQQIDDRPSINTPEKEENGAQDNDKPLAVWTVGKFFNRKKGLEAQEEMLRNLLTKEIDSREDSPCDETDPTHESRILREEVEMNLSNAGKAWNLVEAALSLETKWMKTIARDDMFFLAERLLEAREEYQKEHGKCYVDIAYHHTRKENLKTIATNGLLTKSEREKKNIKSIFHGSAYGDGIYCSSDPVKYAKSYYGDTTIVLACMRGIEQKHPARVGKKYNTLRVGSKGDINNDFCVLQCSNQCIPLFHFPTELLKPIGNRRIAHLTPLFYQELADFQDSLQHRIIDKFLNQHPYPKLNPTYSDRYWIQSKRVHASPTVANHHSSSHSRTAAPNIKPSSTSHSTKAAPNFTPFLLFKPSSSSHSTMAAPNIKPSSSSHSTTAAPNIKPSSSSHSTMAAPNIKPSSSSHSTTAAPNIKPSSSSHSTTAAPNIKPFLVFVAAVCSGVAIGLVFDAIVLCTMIALYPVLVVWVQSWTSPSKKQKATSRAPDFSYHAYRSTRPMKKDTNIFTGTGSFGLDFFLFLICGVLGTVVGNSFRMPFVGMWIGAFFAIECLIFSSDSLSRWLGWPTV